MEGRKPILPINRWRWGVASVILITCLFWGRLWWLQVWQGEHLGEKAQSRYLRAVVTKAPRGTILDRTGKVLASNEPSFSIVLLPAEFSSDGANIKAICQIVGVPADEINAAVVQIKANKVPLFEPVRLRVGADIATVTRVLEHNFQLTGVTVLEEPLRVYPNGKLAAHILGHVGAVTEEELQKRPELKPFDWTGKMGVERIYDRILQGEHGREVMEVDATGAPIQHLRKEAALAGQTLILTLDASLQAVAETALKGKNGAVVALNPKTGEVLILASSPSFDPNWFSKGITQKLWRWLISHKAHPLQNRAIASAHPPGSAFKVVTAVAALAYGRATPYTRLRCGGGRTVGRRFFRCWSRHGTMDLERAIGQSCDSYFYTLGIAVGPERLAKVGRLMGLGEKTGIDLPGENAGVLPTPDWKWKRYRERWYGGDTANMAIGQGYVATTPLQMALVACAVANEGIVMKPHLLLERRDANGKVLERVPPKVLHHLDAPPSVWKAVKQGMLAAVYGSGGTAWRMRDLPIRVAGKTGSSQHRKGKKTHAWFIAFAPAEDPQIALAVMVEEAGHGGQVAAPIAKQVLQAFVMMKKAGREVQDAKKTIPSSRRR